MKLNVPFKCFIALFALLIYSCSSDDGGGDSPSVTSITLTSSSQTLDIGGQFTFTVKDNNNQDVTSQSTITVGGVAISGNTYTANAAGTYQVKATYNNVTSNVVSITVNQPQAQLSAITLSVDESSKLLGNTFTFSVIGNDGQDYTADATFAVDGTNIQNNTYVPTEAGNYNVTATYSTFTSNTVAVTAEVRFKKKVLVEDYTGTWCGYCPRVAYGIEQLQGQTDQAVVVAIHRGSTNSSSGSYDPFNYNAQDLETLINLSGYPTAKLNRTTDWQYPEPNNIAQVTGLTGDDAEMGLAIESAITGSNVNIDVKVKFGKDFTNSNLKLVVYLLEDDLIHDQRNYTSYYGGVSVINNFEHDHVLRESLTSLLGENIPSASTGSTAVYTKNFNMAIPSSITDSSKMSIVAFVVGSDNKAINSRAAHANEMQSFEQQ